MQTAGEDIAGEAVIAASMSRSAAAHTSPSLNAPTPKQLR